MKKICAYAICKNEIKHVHRWLEQVKEADEVVVLDTGSTDGTWEVLQNSDVRCFRKIIEPFRFDVARNESLALVPSDCEICLPLDLDMILPIGWAMAVRCSWSADLCVLEIPQYFVPNNKSGIWFAHRRNAVTWKYPVYEQLECNGVRKPTASTVILHDFSPDKETHGAYISLANLAIAENPNDPYCKITRQKILEEHKKYFGTEKKE